MSYSQQSTNEYINKKELLVYAQQFFGNVQDKHKKQIAEKDKQIKNLKNLIKSMRIQSENKINKEDYLSITKIITQDQVDNIFNFMDSLPQDSVISQKNKGQLDFVTLGKDLLSSQKFNGVKQQFIYQMLKKDNNNLKLCLICPSKRD